MAFSYGFYNSLGGDRKYDAEDISKMFDGIVTDGVVGAVGNTFAVKANSGNTVTVDTGRAWFDHTWSLNDAIMPVECSASGVLLDRYDAIVLEVNSAPDKRMNSIKVISGEEASSPAKPAMAMEDYLHQYPLAYILRKAGSSAINQSDITNAVGTSECPLCTGVLTSMSADQIIAQWEAAVTEWFNATKTTYNGQLQVWSSQFHGWFDDLKTNLDGDVAANLLNKIHGLSNIYYATLTLDGWGVSDLSDYPYAQTAILTAEESTAPSINENSTFLSDASFTPTTSASTNHILDNVLEIINEGVTKCGDNTVTVYVENMPTAEITAKWELRG